MHANVHELRLNNNVRSLMPRLAFILFFAANILCSGCRTHSPEVQATLEKYRMVKQGMTRSQVYAILPQQDIFWRPEAETEEWEFDGGVRGNNPPIMTKVFIDVTFDADGRASKVKHHIATFHLGILTE
jgi:hypothetical protein